MEKLPNQTNALTFAVGCLMGLPVLLMVLCKHIYIFYALCCVYGMGRGAVGVACNSGCLETWRGRDDGGPMMHGLHFFFAFGTFLGPMLAAPFLEQNDGIKVHYNYEQKMI